jgi:hypothetical protein
MTTETEKSPREIAPSQGRPRMTGIEIIAAERKRQVEVKGYTSEHDDEHDMGELALAAALYALPYDAKVGGEPFLTQDDFIGLHIALETGCDFFVDPEPDKLKRLAKAGALIAAEIDRVTRAEIASAIRGKS